MFKLSSGLPKLNENKKLESSFFKANKSKDSESEEELNSDDDMLVDDDDLTLALLYQGNKLGCSFFDANKKTLFYLNDLPETSVSNFELTNLILNDLRPNKLITSAKADSKFIAFLKKKCNLDGDKSDAEDSENETEQDSQSDSETELNDLFKNNNIKLFLTTSHDYNYEFSKELIYEIKTLDKMPRFTNDSEKETYFSYFFDFDAKLAIRSIGGLIKYFERTEDDNFEINYIKPLNLDKILLLDSNAFKSLQIFNPTDLSCAYRQTNVLNSNTLRTHLSSKNLNFNNITLYGLYLSRMQTKIGISKLRSFLMKPIRDIDILNERHKVIDAFCSNQNQELTAQIRNSLKKCKFISSILKRMKLTRIKWSEWKRLYKTTQALFDIFNLSLSFNDILNKTMPKTTSDLSSFLKQDKNILHKNSTFISGANQEFDFKSTPKSRQTQSGMNSTIRSNLFQNDSSENLFSRIHATNYGPKFEYLLRIFENTINIEESNHKNSCSVLPNISSKLDEQKRIFAQLPEILTEINRREITKYNLNACCCMYLPNHGFFLVIRAKSFLAANNSFESTFNTTIRDQIDKIRIEVEQKTDLKLRFSANDEYYYKNESMIELDKKYGDIASIIKNLEFEIVDQLQDEFMKHTHHYSNLIDLIAELDTLLAFSHVANEFNYIKPELHLNNHDLEADSFIYAKEARHPLAEIFLDGSSFVSNDIISGDCSKLNENIEINQCNKVKIITSPNASGKTMYCKQVGLIVYMAMIGSYVPALKAIIGDFDRIFTRINSSDCVSEGKSTFQLDVQQVADALNGSSSKSLLLIDEFGKGTKAVDGHAILASLVRYWINKPEMYASPHVYISTHFYEMLNIRTKLFGENDSKIEYLTFQYMFENEQNLTFENNKLVFLYKLKSGITQSSFAINIAKQMGLPQQVVNRATQLLNLFNSESNEMSSENRFHLLNTNESEANLNYCRNVVKSLIEIYYNLNKQEATNIEKLEKYKQFFHSLHLEKQ